MMDKVKMEGDTIYAMIIAMVIVLMLIGTDLHEHMKVIATWKDYGIMLTKVCMPVEWLLHLFLLVLQCQYSLLLGLYSFYVIFTQDGLQNIFMNCTALLFLNEIDDYVCKVFKLFLKNSEDTMFLLASKQNIKGSGVKLDVRAIFTNFFPKIYASFAVFYLLVTIWFEYTDV